MKDITEHLKFLGHKVRHKAYGIEGVVTSISFDLNGCIQAAIRPQGVDEHGKLRDSFGWFDTKGLTIISLKPLQEQPAFAVIPGGPDSLKPCK